LHSGAALYFARRPFSTSFLSGRGTPKWNLKCCK
jgi:hypothetical protein